MKNKQTISETIQYVTEHEKCDYSSLIDKAHNICVFGTGNMLKDSWEFLKEKISVKYFCDNDEKKWGKLFYGVPCINPCELKKLNNPLVIIAVGAYKEVSQQLDDMGIKYVNYFNVIWDSVEQKLGERWLLEEKEKILKAYDLMDDDSKEMFVQIFCNRVEPLKACLSYKDLNCRGTQYFDFEEIRLGNNENFVDCGAYDGDTIACFLEKVSGKFEHITAFEMDKENFRKLKQFIEDDGELTTSKVNLFNVGVWSEKNWMAYDETNDMHTHLTEKGEQKVFLDKLDDILKNKKVSFIKMDIEGAEAEALKGASEIICKQKPRLAICIYHKLTDLWEIPTLLNKLNPEYKFALRHYSDYWSETVCYAY